MTDTERKQQKPEDFMIKNPKILENRQIVTFKEMILNKKQQEVPAIKVDERYYRENLLYRQIPNAVMWNQYVNNSQYLLK